MPGFEAQEERSIETPWGEPSDPYVVGKLAGKEVAFLARHGRGHRISPCELNFRANIYGFKALGVERILSLSAVGSLKEEHKPHGFRNSRSVRRSYAGPCFHVLRRRAWSRISALRIPSVGQLAKVAHKAGADAGVNAKLGGTYLCMEGPAFSTLAESNLYRSWGMDVIGMTNLQEAKLAREAEICYVTIAMVTDYDCWHPQHDAVTVDEIIAVSEPECGERVQAHCGRGRCDAGGTRMQVRPGAGARADHRSQGDTRRDAQETGAVGWEISLTCRPTIRSRMPAVNCSHGVSRANLGPPTFSPAPSPKIPGEPSSPSSLKDWAIFSSHRCARPTSGSSAR